LEGELAHVVFCWLNKLDPFGVVTTVHHYSELAVCLQVFEELLMFFFIVCHTGLFANFGWPPVPLHQPREFVLQKATSDINHQTFQHALTSLQFTCTFAQEIVCLSQEGHCCSCFTPLGFL